MTAIVQTSGVGRAQFGGWCGQCVFSSVRSHRARRRRARTASAAAHQSPLIHSSRIISYPSEAVINRRLLLDGLIVLRPEEMRLNQHSEPSQAGRLREAPHLGDHAFIKGAVASWLGEVAVDDEPMLERLDGRLRAETERKGRGRGSSRRVELGTWEPASP